MRLRRVPDIVPAAFANDSVEPSRVQCAMRMLALGSGIDKSLNLNVFLNLVLDASNNYKGLRKVPIRFVDKIRVTGKSTKTN